MFDFNIIDEIIIIQIQIVEILFQLNIISGNYFYRQTKPLVDSLIIRKNK